MVKSLRESKAKLSELVELASHGEEILITVRGKVKARLTGVADPTSRSERKKWVAELRALQKKYRGRKSATPAEDVLAEFREDRL